MTGIYLYDHHIFEAVHAIQPSGRGELEISDAHQFLVDRGYNVGYAEITGWWKDTGKPEDLLEANRLIGPFTSIHHGCEIRNSEVEYSIVLEGCRIIDADSRIERSLLGREVEIIKCSSKPLTQKFIVGDQSRIELI